MQATVHESKQSIMQRILTVFVFTLLIATVGLFYWRICSCRFDAAAFYS